MPATGSQGMHSQGTAAFVANWDAILPAGAVYIGELIDADLPEMSVSATKLTHLNSPGKAHEYVPGQKDIGQLRLRFNYNAAVMVGLASLIPGSALNPDTQANNWGRKIWLVSLPDGLVCTFFGFLAGMPQKVQEDDRVEMEVTVKMSGGLDGAQNGLNFNNGFAALQANNGFTNQLIADVSAATSASLTNRLQTDSVLSTSP